MRGNNRRNLRPGGVNTNSAVVGMQRRTDHFRNRPLNTSRPPSMHVDEFEKQYNDNGNAGGGANSSSTNNNHGNDSNIGGNNGNDNELLGTMQTSNDNESDRVGHSKHAGKRMKYANVRSRIVGLVEVQSRISVRIHHLPIAIRSQLDIWVIQVSSSSLFDHVDLTLRLLSAPGFSQRDRLPYGYPSSRYK
jgi:hypothetical protein